MPSLSRVDLRPFVSTDRVLFLPGALGKREVLLRLTEVTSRHPAVGDKPAFVKAIFDREDVTSTGIGAHVAIPHARLPSVSGFVISIAVLADGVDFGAQDRSPVRVVVMIAATEQDRQAYLLVLATVAARLKDQRLCEAISQAGDAETVIARFTAQDRP
jgi:mannitol/fructose-specific phosphotransferase system IIA component (Ntr-type)